MLVWSSKLCFVPSVCHPYWIRVVTLIDEDTDDKVKYRVVGEVEADVKQGKISITSPIARALLGKGKKDVVEVSTPGGGKSYEIVRVEFK